MSLGKKDIVKNITSKTQISKKSGKDLLEKFISIIHKESQVGHVKISNFGTFYVHNSPKRIGRNPKTGEQFEIKNRSKVSLRTSNNIKDLLN